MADDNTPQGDGFPPRKRLGGLALCFALLLSCVLMCLPPGAERRLEAAVHLVTEPSQAFARLCARATRGALGGYPDANSRDDMMALQAEAAEYEAALADLRAESSQLAQENTILRNRLGLIESSTTLSLTLCQVLRRDPFSDYYDYLVIDRGLGDGIKNGYCVMNERGLVGVVEEVSFNTSKVLLMTSRHFAMPCQVRSRNVTGLLMGTGTANVKELSMAQPVPKIVADSLDGILFDKVIVGDDVTVSATGEANGHGIVVGKVSEVKSTTAGAPHLVIHPAASLSQLKYVFVVVGKESPGKR